MEIKAKTTCSLRATRTFVRCSLFRLLNPLTEVVILVAVMLFASLMGVFILILDPYSTTPRLIFLLSALLIAIEVFLYFVPGKSQYKSFCKLGFPIATFTFTDEKVKMITENSRGDLYENNDYNYSVFYKAVETKEYIFLYLTAQSSFLIDKSTVENGSATDIRTKLQSYLGKKYRIRNI